jgi:hypothetical protein
MIMLNLRVAGQLLQSGALPFLETTIAVPELL